MSSHIKNFIKQIIGIEDNWKFQLLTHWDSIIGDLGSVVKIERIDEKTLILGVCDSCWMQELYILSPLLLKTINKSLGKEIIKQIRFKLLNTKQKKLASVMNSISLPSKNSKLTSREETALACISDPELRAALAAFAIRCHREQ